MDRTIFESFESFIQEPSFDAVKLRSKLGFEANPEKKLPDAAAPLKLKYETYNSSLELTEIFPVSPVTL